MARAAIGGMDFGELFEVEWRGRSYAIAKVLEGRYLSDKLPGCVGVGTPFVVHDPDTREPYLLFTAWSDVHGIARRVWVAPLREDLTIDVSKAREVIKPSAFSAKGLATCHAFWDDHNEEWVVFVSFYHGPSGYNAGVAFLDKDFNLKGVQLLNLKKADGSSINVGDGGVCPVPLDDYLLLSAGQGIDRSLFVVTSPRDRPFPDPAQLNAIDGNQVPIVPSYIAANLDVHQTLFAINRLVMLSELRQFRDLWFIQVYYGPEKDLLVGSTWVPFAMPAPIDPPFPIHFTELVGNVGHPHYAVVHGLPVLFFARFPTWAWGGRRAYAHDIMAWILDSYAMYRIFSPRGKTLVWSTGNISSDTWLKLPIPTFGAKTVTIAIHKASASGTLTVRESSSPYHIYVQDGDYHDESISISSGSNKIIINRPEPYIALRTDVGITSVSVYIEA